LANRKSIFASRIDNAGKLNSAAAAGKTVAISSPSHENGYRPETSVLQNVVSKIPLWRILRRNWSEPEYKKILMQLVRKSPHVFKTFKLFIVDCWNSGEQ